MASAPRQSALPRRPAAPPPPETQPDDIIGDFRRGREIGKGSFATVFLAQHRKKKSYAAVKVVQMSKLTKKLKENLDSEISILKSLQHPHIVALFACVEMPTYIYLVMEYCQLSDLSQFMKKRAQLAALPETADIFNKYPNQENGGLNEVLTRHFLKQMASALSYLRNRNLIHRDIKPQNLLLNPSPSYMAKQRPEDVPLAASAVSLVPTVGIGTLPMLKIADFGFARHLPSTAMAETLCGSPLYMAPEILRYEKYDARADLWSCGTVLYEMVVGKPPFRAQNHVDLLRRIEKANDIITFDRNLPISREMKNTIRSLLKKDPKERVSYERFFADPLITGDIPGLSREDTSILMSPSSPDPDVSELSRRMAKQTIDAAHSLNRPSPEPRLHPRPSQDEVSGRLSRPSQDEVSGRISRPSQDEVSGRTSRPSDQGPVQHRGEIVGRRKSSSASQDHPEATSAADHVRVQPSQRPGIVAHATAPARQELHAGTAAVSNAPRMERRASRSSPLAGPPMVREQSGAETHRPIAPRSPRTQRDRTAQDVADEREYVLVDGNHVKVNAIADELDANAHVHSRTAPRSAAGPMTRRATTQGQPTSVTGATPPSPSRGMQMITGRHPHQRNPSFDRRLAAATPQSAANMLTKALNAVNVRLFGTTGTSPPLGKGSSPPIGYGAFPAYPAPQGALAFGDALESKGPVDEDVKIVRTMEEAAHRSDVIFGFAEVKFRQLLPATPSTRDGLAIQALGSPERVLQTSDDDEEEKDMTTVAIVGVAEEALVLYVKTLAILAKTIDLAGYWWVKHNRGDVMLPGGASPRSGSPTAADVSKRMNNIVQWARGRFNECLEKSEVVGRRLVEAQRKLPEDHPAHPTNHPTSSASAGAISASTGDHIQIISGITAERLMFERAVEMSRAAAVNELVGEDLQDCELGYRTAIMLFEGALEADDEPLMRKPSAKKDRSADKEVKGIEGEERQTVIKLIEGARARLSALRKKAAQHAQPHVYQPPPPTSSRRTGSVSAGSASKAAERHSSSSPSANAAPVIAGTPHD